MSVMPCSRTPISRTISRTVTGGRSRSLGSLLLVAGLTSGLLLVDTSAAPSASAAQSHDLARLRACESGGNYRINTGNGYYGAYQFDRQTWRALGYSGMPHQADPATQDDAVRKLQSRRGWGPWPACSRKLGLRGALPPAQAAPAAVRRAVRPKAAPKVVAPGAGTRSPAPTTTSVPVRVQAPVEHWRLWLPR